MAKVFGTITLNCLIDVDSEEETLGLLQANYKINFERFVKWKLTAIDSHGKEHSINICDCSEVLLNEFLD